MKLRLFRWLDKALSRPYRNFPVLNRDNYGSHPDISIWTWDLPETITFDIPPHIGQTFDWIREITGTRSFLDPFILRVEQGQIHGRHALLLTRDHQVIAESLFAYLPNLQNISAGRIHYPQSMRDLRDQIIDVPHFETAYVVANMYGNAFYHWMIETLPRLWLLREYQLQTGEPVQVVVSQDLPDFARETLDWLGFDRVVEWKATFAKCDTLLAPFAANSTGIPSPRLLKPLSGYLKAQIAGSTGDYTRYIYISRAKASRRRVTNEDDVMAILRPLGFELYYLEDMSLTEQIRLFDHAEIVIGPHGAGFSNCIHSSGIKLIEFFEPSYINICFYCLAAGYEFDYGYLVGTSQGADIEVDTAQLQDLLSMMGIL